MLMQRNARRDDLERRFPRLESSLKDTPKKDAISVLHALIQESQKQPAESGTASAGKPTLEDVANLYKSAPGMQGKAENEGLPAGARAPDFTLKDANGKTVSLADFRGQNVVLAFYPLDWSPACSDQLSLYQNELAEFQKYDAQVIGISIDSLYSHGAWAAVRQLTFPLLADFSPKGEVARRYRVMREGDGFTERALYVVDREGVIRYSHVSPELHKIPSIYGLFDHLKALTEQPEAAASRRR
jgi:peroxiredoxin